MSRKVKEELDVKEIVRTIKKNAQSRQLKADLQMLGEIDIRTLEVKGYETEKLTHQPKCESLEDNLYYLNTHYTISDKIQSVPSRRGGILGKAARCIMNRVVFVVGESLKKLIETQQEFNVRTVRIFNAFEKMLRPADEEIEKIKKNIDSLQSEVTSLSKDIEESVSDVASDVADVKESVTSVQEGVTETKEAVADLQKSLEENVDNLSGVKEVVASLQKNLKENADNVSCVEESVTALQKNIGEVQENLKKEISEKIANIGTVVSEERTKELARLKQSIQYPDLKIDYTAFEDKFRGAQSAIEEKFKKYLRFFHECKNVMDIGCGRGEFIELLHANGSGAFGVEIDEKMVEICREKNLNVPHIDAVSYLKEQLLREKPDEIDGIFSAQVVEHLHMDYLMEMLRLCHGILQPDKFIVLETINIRSLSTFTNAVYLDPTHVNPLHPETLKFLLESVGFRDVEFIFSSEFSADEKLLPLPEDTAQARVFNKNVEKLNELLFAPQDYAVIAQK